MASQEGRPRVSGGCRPFEDRSIVSDDPAVALWMKHDFTRLDRASASALVAAVLHILVSRPGHSQVCVGPTSPKPQAVFVPDGSAGRGRLILESKGESTSTFVTGNKGITHRSTTPAYSR